jgi:hypothetical protein
MTLDDGTNTNRAVARFNEAMDTTMTSPLKYVDCWCDPNGVILVHLENGDITVVHGVKNVGGTFDTPGSRIVGHIGTNTRAFAGVINHTVGASTVVCTLPTKAEQANCMTIEELKNLKAPTPEDATVDDEGSTASKRGQRGKKNEDSDRDEDNISTTNKNKKKKKGVKTAKHDIHTLFAEFKLAPHLQKMIIESVATNPEALLVHVRESMDDFEYPPDSNEDDYHVHMDRFKVWCFGVMMKQVSAVAILIGGVPQSSRSEFLESSKNTPHKVGEEKCKESKAKTANFGKD